MKRTAIAIAAACIGAVFSGEAWAQSAIPAEQNATVAQALDANNWLQVTGTSGNGDPDRVQVVFFEVPDTVSTTLYFAVRDPGGDGDTQANGGYDTAGVPDQDSGGATTFTLIGGTGAISSANAKLIYYATPATAYTGSTLSSFSEGNVDDASGTSPAYGWVYFAGVSPSEGEHIGNKYYFKVIAEADASVGKNAFQLNASYINSGWPTGISGVRSFAYAWTLALRQRTTSNTYSLYPFVGDSETGNVAIHNWDMDSGEALSLSAKTGYGLGALTASANGVTWATSAATDIFSIPTVETNSGLNQRNGTWTITVTENANPVGTDVNPAVFWASNSTDTAWDGEATDIPRRIYAAPYTPNPADHVTITLQDGAAKADGTETETVTLQLVDSSGSPVSYVRTIYVKADKTTAVISPNATASPALAYTEALTTNADGMATFTISDTVAETVTLTLETNGASGDSADDSALDTPASNESAQIVFATNPEPKLYSASNTSFTELNAQALPVVTVDSNGGTKITAAGDIRIRIPSTLTANFLTTDTDFTGQFGGAASGKVSTTVSFPDSRTFSIDVTTDFASTDTLTITGLSLTAVNSDGSGYLELSYDNGATWTVADSKRITILDTNQTYTWIGTTTAWALDTNWSPTGIPDTNTENALIPYMSSGIYPTISAATTVNNLTVGSGASLTAGSNLTIAGTISSSGTIAGTLTLPSTLSGTYSTGGGDLSFTTPITLAGDTTLATGSGSVTFSGTAAVTGAGYALYIDSDGAVAFNTAIGSGTAVSRLQVSGGGSAAVNAGASFSAAGNTIQYDVPVTFNADTTLSETTGSIIFNDTVALAAGVDLTLTAPEVDFNGGAGSVTGTATSTITINAYSDAAIQLAEAAQGDANLELTAADLSAIAAGFQAITIATAGGISWEGTATLNSPTTLAGDFILTSGIMTLGDALNASGTVTLSGGTLVDGGNAITTTGTAVALGGTLTLTGSWAFGASANLTSNGLALNDASVGNTFTLTLQDAAAFAGTVSGAGTLDANSQAISIGGDWTISAFTEAGSTVTFGGTAAQSVTGDSVFAAIVIDKTAGSVSFGPALTASSLVTGVNKDFAVSFNATAGAQASTIAGSTMLDCTGAISFGDDAGDSVQFTGGVAATATGGITLIGSLLTDGGGVDFTGLAISLASTATIDTEQGDDGNAGAVTLTGATVTAAGAYDLAIDASTIGAFAGGNVALGAFADAANDTVNLTIDTTGGGSNGTFAAASAVFLTGTLTLDVGAGNDADVSAGSTDIAALAVTSANNVTVSEASGFDIAGAAVSGNLTITSTGSVTDSAAVSVGGNLSVTVADTMSISLNTTTNTFNGSLAFAASAGNIADLSIYDTTAVTIPAPLTITGTMTITSENTIDQAAGALAGATLIAKTLNDAGAAITLNDAGNDFDTISILSRDALDTAADTGAISYADADGFQISATDIRTAGNVELTAGGAATEAVGGIVEAAGLRLLGAGPYTLDEAANVVSTLAGNVTGAISFNNSGNLLIGTVTTIGLTSGSTIALASTGTITQGAGALLSATTLDLSSSGSITLTEANTVTNLGTVSRGGAFAFNNSGALTVTGTVTGGTTTNNAAIASTGLLTVNAAVSATGAGTASLTGAGVTVSAAVTGAGGVSIDAGTGTFTNTAATGSLAATDSAITVTADGIDLGAASSIGAGAGDVRIQPTTGTTALGIGSAAAGFNLTGAEINTVSTSGTLYLGDAANTGAVTVSTAAALTVAGTVTILNGSSDIAVNASLSASAALTLQAGAAITDDGSGSLASAGALTLSADAGIGSIAGNPIDIGAVASLSAANATSGDIFLSTTGSTAIGVAGFALSQFNGGAVRIDSGGDLSIDGDVGIGAGTLTLNATGTITRSGAFTLTAGTVNLGTAGATTDIGVSGTAITTIASNIAAQATTGPIWISNTGDILLTAVSASGLVDVVNTGTTTTSGVVTAASTVNIDSSDALSIGHDVTGPTGVTLTVTGAGLALTQTGGIISAASGAIALTADAMDFQAAGEIQANGTAVVTIEPYDATRAITIGTGSSGLGLTALSLQQITTANSLTIGSASITGTTTVDGATTLTAASGPVLIRNAAAGGIAVNSAFSVPGAITLTTTAGVSGVGAISSTSSQSLIVNAQTTIDLTGASTVRYVALSSATTGDITYSGSDVGSGNTLDITAVVGAGTGSVTINETTGSVSNAAGAITASGAASTVAITAVKGMAISNAVTGPGGVTLTVTEADATLTHSAGAISATDSGIALVADDMTLSGGTISSGTGNVSLYPNDPAQPIDLGTDAAGASLGITDAEIDTITTTGLLTVGNAANTGGIAVTAAISPLAAIGDLTLTTIGPITDGGSGSLSASGLLSLNAATGIGDITGTQPVHIDSVGSLSAVNTTSGDIFLSTTSDVTVDAAGFAITAYTGATVRVDGGGNLVIGGDIAVNSGTIILNATGGTITRSGAFTLTAANVALGTAGATTGVGASGAEILIDAASVAAESTGTAEGIYIDSTGTAALTVGYSGSGLAITGNNAPIVLTAAGDVTVSQAVSANGTGAVTLASSAAATALATSAAIGATANGIITLAFDAMSIGAAVSVGATGSANAYLHPYTAGTDSSIGGVNAFDLGDAELDLITAGTIFIGRNAGGTVYSDAMTIGGTEALTLGTKNIAVYSSTDIQGGANALTCGTLTLSAASGIGSTTAINSAATIIAFTNSTSNAVTISNAGSVSVSGTNSSAGSAISVVAASGTLTTGAITATGAGAVNLTADDMDITGTVTAGADGANLTTYTAGNAIFLGGSGTGLSLSEIELNRISTAGTLTIGDSTHTGDITINGDVALVGPTCPTGPVILGTDGGAITVTNAFATAANGAADLTLDARTGAATTGVVTGAGQLTAGNAGSAALVVDAGDGISLTNATGNLAATVTLTNSGNVAASNIAYVNNRAVSLSATNSSTDGTLSLANNTGLLTLTNATTSGAGTANVVISAAAGGLSLTGPVTAAGTGYVSIASAGAVSQGAAAGVITASTGGLELTGTGPFTLNTFANPVAIAAADTNGSVAFLASAAFTVGTVNATSGIDTTGGSGGAVTLQASAGSITLAQDILTNGGDVSIQRPVLLSGTPRTIDTDLADAGTTNAGSVTFTGTIDNASALVVDATADGTGTSAAVDFQSVIGATSLLSIAASGLSVRFGGNVTTTGSQTATATTVYTNGIHDSTAGNGNINFGNSTATTLTLQASTRLQSGSGTISLGNVTDGASSFTLTLGDAGAAQTGAATIYGATTINGLATVGSAYDIFLNYAAGGQASTVDTNTVFANTGSLQIGDDATDSFAFTAGVQKTTAGTKTLAGTISTTASAIDFGTIGDVVLAAATILNPTSGQIDLYSMTSAANVNLEIQGSGTANLGAGNALDFLLGTGALVLSSKTSGAVTMNGATVTMNSITPPAAAQSFTLRLLGNLTTVTAAANLTNAGILVLGDADTDSFSFPGGLTKIGAYQTRLWGTVATGGSALTLTTTGGVALYGATTLSTGAGTVQLAAVTCDIPAGHDLSLAASGAATATIASANFGTGGSLDLTSRLSTGTLTLSATLTALDLVAPSVSTAFALTLNGGSTTNGVDLSNQTGTLTINSGGFAFNGGMTKSSGSVTLAGGSVLTDSANGIDFGSGLVSVTGSTVAGGDAAGDTGTITMAAVTISAGQTLGLGSGAENCTYSVIGAVNGGGSLAINTAGASGSVVFSSTVGAGTALTALTVTNSYGVDFQSSVQAGTVTLTDTTAGRTIRFQGDLTASTALTTGAQDFDLSFNAGAGAQTTTITGNTNLQIVTTGSISFGNAATDIFLVNGTLTSSGTATRHLIGKIRTAGAAISFGAVTLDGDTTIDSTNNLGTTTGATVSTGAVTGGANAFVVNAGTTGGFTQSAGTITAGSLRIIANGAIGTAMGTPVSTAVSFLEARSYSGTVFVSNTGALTVGFAGGDFEALITGGLQTTALNAGLAADAGSDITFAQSVGATTGSFTATANSLDIGAAITANGGISLYPNADALGIALQDGTGTFSLTAAELGFLSSSGTVVIGLGTNVTGAANAINIGGSGQIDLSATGYHLTLQSFNQPLAFAGGTGPVLQLSTDKTLTIALGTGAITGSGVVDITLPLASTGGILNINSAGSIGTGTGAGALQTNVDQIHVASTGAVYVSESNGIQLGSAGGNIASTGGLIDIAAAGSITTSQTVTTSAGSLKIASSSGTTTISNDVSTTGAGTTIELSGTDVALNANVTAVSPSTITITAATGAITRGAGTVTTAAGALTLSAGTYIGTSTVGNEINTAIAILNATAGNGGVYIAETNGIQLGGASTVQATSGDIVVNAAGAITTGNTVQTVTSGSITAVSSGSAVTLSNTMNAATNMTATAAAANALTLSGTITAGAAAALTGPSGIAVSGTFTGGTGLATFNNATTNTGTITSGTGGLIFVGTFSGAGSLVGSTAGIITFQGNTTLGTLTPASSTFAFTGTLTPQTFNTNGNAIPSTEISKSAVGNVLRIATSNVAQAASASLIMTAGTLDLATNSRTWTLQNSLAVGTNALVTVGAGTLNGGQAMTIGGTGLVTHGTGTITQASLGVSGTGTYTGTGTGTLSLSGALSMSGGTLTLGTKTITAGTISVTGGALALGSAQITLTGAGGANAINTSGTITDTASLITMIGANATFALDDSERIGDLTISAANVGISDGNAATDIDVFTVTVAGSPNIASGTIASNGTTSVAGTLSASAGANYTSGAALTVSGTGSIAMSTGILSVAAGGMSLTGSGSISSAGTAANAIAITGNLAWSGTASATMTLTGTGALSVSGNFVQTGTASGAVTTGSGGVSVTGQLTNYALLRITGGNLAVSGAGANTNTGTIETLASGAQTYAGTMANSGTITGYGLVTFTGDVANTGTINAGPVLAGSEAIRFVANYSSSGALNGNATTDPDISFQGNVAFGTFTHAGDRIVFYGPGAQTFNTGGNPLAGVHVAKTGGSVTLLANNASQALSGGTLTFVCTAATAFNLNGLAWTLGAACDVNANVSFNALAGTLNGTQALTVSADGILNHSTGTLTLSSLAHSSTSASTLGTGNIGVSGTLAVSAGSVAQTGNEGANVHSLGAISVSGGSLVWDSGNSGGDLTVSGAIAASSGTLDFGNKTVAAATLDVNGTANLALDSAQITLNGASGANTINTSGSITDTASLITLSGASATLALDDTERIGDLTVNATGIVITDNGAAPDVDLIVVTALGGAIIAAGDTISSNTTTSVAGTLSASAGANYTSGAALTVSGTGSIAMSTGTLYVAAGGMSLTGSGSISSAGTAANAIAITGNLAWSGTASATMTLTGTGALSVSGNFVQTATASGSVTTASGGVSVTGQLTNYNLLQITGGNLVVSGAGATTNAGSIETLASGTQTYTGTMANSGTITGYDLVTFTGNVTNTGTINAGPVPALSEAIRFVGNYSSSGALNGNATTDPDIAFQGNVAFGTFSHNDDRIVFYGSGAQTFDTGGNPLADVYVAKSGGSVTLINNDADQSAASATLLFNCTAATAFNLNGLAWTLGAACDVNANVAFNALAGTLNGTQALTVSADGILSHSTGTLTLSSLAHSSTSASTLGTGNIGVSGTLAVSAGSVAQTGNEGANVHSLGAISVSGGSLVWDSLNAGGDLTVSGAIAASAGTLDFGDKTVAAATLDVNGTANLALDSAQITLSAAPNVIDTTGSITDTASLLTLTGAGGNLTLDTDETIGDLTISADTTMIKGGLVKDLIIDAGITLNLNAAANVIDLLIDAASTVTANGTLRIQNDTNTVTIASQTNGTQIVFNGTDIDYNANAVTLRDIDAAVIDTDIESGAAVTIENGVVFQNVALGGGLNMTAGSTLDANDLIAAAGSAIANGGANTITASGDVSILGSFSNPTNSTLVMTGAGTTLTATPPIGDLTADATASVTLGSALSLADDLNIVSGGTLDASASNWKITIAGDTWNNQTASGGFIPRAGEVEFTAPSGTVSVSGNNDWYDFTCTVAGLTFAFENNRTQQFQAGGTFTLTGTLANQIVLTRQTGTDGDDLDWVPPAVPDPAIMWQIDMLPPSTIALTYVTVKYSDARAHPIVKPDDVTVFSVVPDGVPAGEIGKTCFKWLNGLEAVYSFTEDSDDDGRIDRLRIRASAALNGDFSGFSISVNGYDIDTTIGTNGYVLGSGSLYFYAYLVEKEAPDSDATPTWTIPSGTNTTLKDNANNKYLLGTIEEIMQTVDTAPPVPAYALTLPERQETYLRFSEPIYQTGGTVADYTSFSAAGSAETRLATSGNGTSEYLLPLSANPTVSTLAGGATTGLSATLNDNAAAPAVDYSTDAAYLGLGYPAPEYATSYGVYTAYAETGSGGLAPPNRLRTADQTHRLTDVLVSVPPAASTDATYFVWPVWARDSVTTEIDQSVYDTLTGAEAASQTIGLVRDFTGTQWLRDQDITLESWVNSALGTPSAVRVHFAADVAAGYLTTDANSGSAASPTDLWLPTFDESAFSVLVPFPYSGHSTAAGTNPSGQLWDFALSSSDANVRSVSTLDFYFTLGALNTTNPLYAARLDIAQGDPIPADWYTRVLPFSFAVHDVTKQRGSVTILNNVINPNNGETTRVSYQLSKAGRTTVQVFTLDGDLVDILYRGTRAAGDYTAVWDGKNRGGRAVARGIYFIRVVAPDIDEIRKVLVVK